MKRLQGPQVAKWERELNALIYEFYILTNEGKSVSLRRQSVCE